MNTRRVRIDIDLEAIRHNATLARSLHGNQLFAVIKADAYGHGAVAVARALTDIADGFAVVTVAEALELRAAGIDAPVLVMQGPMSESECQSCAVHGLWPVLHECTQIEIFRRSAYASMDCWIKIDTGMGRLGLLPDDAVAAINDTTLNVQGVMTHLACADTPEHHHVHQQLTVLDEVLGACSRAATPAVSVANSAAVIGWPSAHRDWARPGLMLHGVNPLDTEQLPGRAGAHAAVAQLRPAMRVSAPLVAVRNMPAGSTLGYGCHYVCPHSMRVGIVGIGYGDGLPRVLNQARVWYEGAAREILGRVSMDSIAIDLGDAPAEAGAPVVLWGPEWPVEHLARAAGTIGYELLCHIHGERHWHGG